jgi:dTDP-4-amino-4,6-dideoxygalactose transaminase
LYQQAIYHGDRKAEDIYGRTFCLPSSVGLSEEEINQVVAIIDQ